MKSNKGMWNGDVDLENGKLQELREVYDGRVNVMLFCRKGWLEKAWVGDKTLNWWVAWGWIVVLQCHWDVLQRIYQSIYSREILVVKQDQQHKCHDNNMGVIMFLLWCTFLVPSLKSTALTLCGPLADISAITRTAILARWILHF